jgi:hypothetical protein
MLTELSVVEQRFVAVKEVLDRAKITANVLQVNVLQALASLIAIQVLSTSLSCRRQLNVWNLTPEREHVRISLLGVPIVRRLRVVRRRHDVPPHGSGALR